MSQSPTSHHRPQVDRESAAASGSPASTSKPSYTVLVTNMTPTRNRLTAAGSSIMEEHWDKFPGQMPSVGKRKEILQLVTQLPGCEFYRSKSVTNWFRARIAKFEKENTRDARFLSLSPAVIEHLSVLVKNQRNPSADVVATWAKLLKVKPIDIVAWLDTQCVPQQEVHLPTPASTVTPESSASPRTAPQEYPSHYHTHVKQDPSVSPVLTPAIPASAYYRARPPSHLSQSTVTSPAIPAFPLPMSPLSPVENSKSWHPHVITLETAIVQGVRDAVAKPPTAPMPLPKSAAEFNAMFAPYEDNLAQLYRAFGAS